MSLTSYRAAPPRVEVCGGRAGFGGPVWGREEGVVLGRSGNDLLSRVLRHSTIGAEEFNGRVRDGIGFLAPRSDHRTGQGQRQASLFDKGPAHRGRRPVGLASLIGSNPRVLVSGSFISAQCADMDHKSDQANRAISTSQLNASPRLHSWPIDVVVFHGSQGRTRFKGGFPLRCLQRLSRPYIATLHCGWRHNSSTRGTSIPVLSY